MSKESIITKAKIVFSFSMADKETVEAKIIRKHYADLTKAVQDPLGLAAELYSANVIARSILDSTMVSTHTKVEKVMYLLQAVSDRITINPKDFHCFLAVLKKDSSLQEMAELMNSTYSKRHYDTCTFRKVQFGHSYSNHNMPNWHIVFFSYRCTLHLGKKKYIYIVIVIAQSQGFIAVSRLSLRA